jgi:cytidyltransferase-like protein
MILSIGDLESFDIEVVMVDGSFDPLHDGHIEYFMKASKLGFPVLCNIATDEWTRNKHQVLLPIAKRALVLDAIRYLSFVTISTVSTAESLKRIKPRIYAKGNDWLIRGGIPKIEQDICDDLNIRVMYLDSVLNSSSDLLAKYLREDL